MLSEIILRITGSMYWDFCSTLVAMLVGIFCTIIASKYYFNKASEISQMEIAMLMEEINKLTGKEVKIVFDKKGMPKKLYFETYSANTSRNIVKD